MMMDNTDSARRAAEVLSADLPAGTSHDTPLVMCGYTGDVLEEVLLGVCETVIDCNRVPVALYPVAA